MDKLSFLKGLQHVVSKNEVAKSCEETLKALRSYTLPSYADAVQHFTTFKPKTAKVKAFATTLRRVAGGNADMFVTLHQAFTNAQALLTHVEQKSDTLFADQESTLALSYQKTCYLELVAALTFATDFGRKFLNYVYVFETAGADADQPVKEALSAAEIDYVEKYFDNFAKVIGIMLRDGKQLEQLIAESPDVVVTELSEQTLPNTIGAAKTDPLGLRHFTLPFTIGVKWNPFYLVAMCVASFQVACHKAAQEERDLLQMRLLNLQKMQANQPDPHLQRQIEHMAERVSKVNREIMKNEEKWGL